jgi:hypothetical protein
MENVFTALKDTPIPTILVIGGLLFLLLSWQVSSSVTLWCLRNDNDGRRSLGLCYSWQGLDSTSFHRYGRVLPTCGMPRHSNRPSSRLKSHPQDLLQGLPPPSLRPLRPSQRWRLAQKTWVLRRYKPRFVAWWRVLRAFRKAETWSSWRSCFETPRVRTLRHVLTPDPHNSSIKPLAKTGERPSMLVESVMFWMPASRAECG